MYAQLLGKLYFPDSVDDWKLKGIMLLLRRLQAVSDNMLEWTRRPLTSSSGLSSARRVVSLCSLQTGDHSQKEILPASREPK